MVITQQALFSSGECSEYFEVVVPLASDSDDSYHNILPVKRAGDSLKAILLVYVR